MNRISIYIRCAIKDKLGKIEMQTEQLKKYAVEREGIVVSIYVDDGHSGCRMLERHSLKKMLRHCRQGKIDNVLIGELSNLARKPNLIINILDELQRNNVALTAVDNGNLDYSTSNILLYSTKRMKGSV